MSTIERDDAADLVVRPHSLSASSLLQRAGFGILVLSAGIFASAWLYDAGTRSNAGETQVIQIVSPSK